MPPTTQAIVERPSFQFVNTTDDGSAVEIPWHHESDRPDRRMLVPIAKGWPVGDEYKGSNDYLRSVVAFGRLGSWNYSWPQKDESWIYMRKGPAKEAAMEADSGRYRARDLLTEKYAWAIPNDAALEALTKLGPILEVAAGSGYWAHLLQEQGVDIIATDCEPGENNWVGYQWIDIEPLDAVESVRKYPNRNLFMSWPPHGDDAGWVHQCLTETRAKYVVYIGEGWGGCTGTTGFYRELETGWHVKQEIMLPQWPGMHDYLQICERKMPAPLYEAEAGSYSDVGGYSRYSQGALEIEKYRRARAKALLR